MGSDLQLTGLASGFDWAPVVDQLIELERIPQKRLEQEKVRNEEKIPRHCQHLYLNLPHPSSQTHEL